jgi:hypothetical protein
MPRQLPQIAILCVPISRARSSRGSDGVRCRGDGAVAIATGNGDRLDGLGSGDGDGPAVQGRGRSRRGTVGGVINRCAGRRVRDAH